MLGCKKVDASKSSQQQPDAMLQKDHVKLNPSEALIQIKFLETKSENTYAVQFDQFLKQSAGFSLYLTKGDTLLVKSKSDGLSGSNNQIIIRDGPSFGGSKVFEFRLVQPEN